MIRRNDDATLIFHEVNPLPQTDWRWWAALGVVVLVGIVAFLTRPGYAPPPPVVIAATVSEPLPLAVAATTLDVSGEWIGYLYIDGYEDVHHTWSLSLQQDGNTITGTSFIQSNYIFDAGGGVDNGYSPIQTTSALMSVQGTVDPTRERIYFQEMQLIATDFAPENASWCHKSGEMMVNIKVMTGVNIAAGNCGMVNIVLTRKR